MKKIPYPKGLRLNLLKSAEKFSSIASAINFKFLHTFFHFYQSANFKMIVTKVSIQWTSYTEKS